MPLESKKKWPFSTWFLSTTPVTAAGIGVVVAACGSSEACSAISANPPVDAAADADASPGDAKATDGGETDGNDVGDAGPDATSD